MGANLKRCIVCGGRGALRCDCWPGDCICGWDDEPCEECEGTGWIDPSYDYDEPEPPPTPTYTPAEVHAIARAAYRAGLEDATGPVGTLRDPAEVYAMQNAIRALPVPADILDRAKRAGQ